MVTGIAITSRDISLSLCERVRVRAWRNTAKTISSLAASQLKKRRK
jgi:hypothetical protein